MFNGALRLFLFVLRQIVKALSGLLPFLNLRAFLQSQLLPNLIIALTTMLLMVLVNRSLQLHLLLLHLFLRRLFALIVNNLAILDLLVLSRSDVVVFVVGAPASQ